MLGRHLLVVVPLLIASAAQAVEAASPEEAFTQGLTAFQRGAFEDAVLHWTDAARAYEQAGRPAERIAALTRLAQAYSALGHYRQAAGTYDAVLALAEASRDTARMASALAGLGAALAALGPPETAEAHLTRGLGLARGLGDSGLAAGILNTLGNLYARQRKYPDAIAAYRESSALAQRAGQRLLAARALSNAAVALRQNGTPQEGEGLLDAAWDHLRQVSPSAETALTLVHTGVAARDLRPALPTSSGRLLLRASAALTEAGAQAERLGDRRTASYAYGYLGTLFEDERRYAEALQLTRKAIFAAQHVNAPESLYRWEWQAGRLLAAGGTIGDAIAAYRRAVNTLQGIRGELSAGTAGPQASFRETAGRVYFEFVDLLLRQAASLQSREQIGAYLVEAREAVELLKVAELRDYFQDDCVDTALSKLTKLDVVSQTAAVVYPIVLPDRTELLVSLPTGLKRFSVPVSAAALTREVRAFRLMLEKRTTRQFLPHAQQLYAWLIRPLEADLASLQIDTLVFVPDGPLRTIPMAALHDGKQFLVAKYALAITPSLNLTDPRPIERARMKVLAVGVTESVQGFPPLPNVSAELQMLRNLFGSTTLLNQEFRVANLEAQLKDGTFTVVHIASHGEFGSDVEKTFVLAFDDRVTMDRLDKLVGVFKFRDDPLELLTLSACDTAAGDERAALGLAGVAIKAGARSAVATLWNINDEASADLVAEFYRELKDPAISRASALRRAQLKMLADPRYEHPGFWSPFLLINNWL